MQAEYFHSIFVKVLNKLLNEKLTVLIEFMVSLKSASMATEIKTSIIINSTPEKIWSILTNFENYSTWNPFIKTLTGEVVVGNNIKVEFDEMTFKPKVLVFKENEKFEWIGQLLFPGLFDGKHRFLIVDNHNGSCTFEHSEKFKGILIPFMKNKLHTEVKANFEKMNMALKKAVEINEIKKKKTT